MKYVLLTLLVMLVCSCDNYIPSTKEHNSDIKTLREKDSINNNGNPSIIINIDSTSHDFNYIINIPTE
ncbi:hypothetical protein [Parabacteroides distasonis]|jgi:hypothetical protein|uniref:hypothetical protein n=1 Tax=Parabacteroides distasonis TaxID=823 RepID=UPI0020559019|nr:MAG TPA: hypothetical protein [Caudoviricetes sp.]